MPVLYLGVLKNTSKPAVELCVERDVSSFGRWSRGTYSEFIDFTARLCAERTKAGTREAIDRDENRAYDYIFHVYGYQGGICGVAVTDQQYDQRVAQAILAKTLQAFTAKYPKSAYEHLQPAAKGSPSPLTLPELKEYIINYQTPENVDPLLKIQLELDETKVFMRKNIEAVLERGEKVDNLVAKSDNLSAQSKMFYTQAKKQNSCCTVM
ncbi:snare-like protein [Periconia macrospinosa]|uniref:Synaptobrevin homolog YKT6 n=1 Tax=Periconia macrospinosa TaxID=97972 RepID=A0A2V1E312_9PLEO|nr:snare-like protein [Periconia macrospinosa]